MSPWTGVALALSGTGEDEMQSRLSTYLHPLAGRPLAWHALAALSAVSPAPGRLILLLSPDVPPDSFREAFPQLEIVPAEDGATPAQLLDAAGVPSDEMILVIDAAAPGLRTEDLTACRSASVSSVMRNDEDVAVGLWVREAGDRACLRENRPLEATSIAAFANIPLTGTPLVRSRETLSRAAREVRTRLVRQQMAEGVTFLLPETVLLDVDVRIGRDVVVYPGVIVEGQTTIGVETVVGPGCRILDSWIGSGVELKGWNYIARTSIRNRAILEPYVRRGFD
jgi:bifunctional N-acetylglucosamine-1-phosphate-uridyltransferase/glucosamine-1-phosphate-acetyltransferase GlmU-like protein